MKNTIRAILASIGAILIIIGFFTPWLGLGTYALTPYEILTKLPDIIKTLKDIQMHEASTALNLMMASVIVYVVSLVPMAVAIRYRLGFSVAIILLISAGIIFHVSVEQFESAFEGMGFITEMIKMAITTSRYSYIPFAIAALAAIGYFIGEEEED